MVLLVVALGSIGVRWKPLIVAFAFAFAVLCASAAQAGTVSSLPASDYAARPVCGAPVPGRARCLGSELVPMTAAARERKHPLSITRAQAISAGAAGEGAYGLRPQDLRSAYFPGIEPDAPAAEPQTIALVDAYNDPNAEAGLQVYDQELHLPECTSANGCFGQVNQNGETGRPPFPEDPQALVAREAVCEQSGGKTQAGQAACLEVEEVHAWALESSSDVELAHAVCQNCRIRLVEASSPESRDLEAAEQTAARAASQGGVGATEISNSWGLEEPLADSEAFNHPGIVITAAAGDFGYLNWTEAEAAHARGASYYEGVEYPASSPHVIAVAATKLTLTSTGARQSETVWNEGPSVAGKDEGADGGGCSLNFQAPSWQREIPDWAAVGCGTGSTSRRAVADVAADGDPYTGVAVYYAAPQGGGGWRTYGGASVSSPIIASMFALAGGAHAVAYPAQTLYSHLGSPSLDDITTGGDGKCDGDYSSGCSGSMTPLSPFDCGASVLICNAGPGYDGPSGVGAPNGLGAFRPGDAEGNDAPEKLAESGGAGSTTTTTLSGGDAPSRNAGNDTSPPHRAAIRVSDLDLTLTAIEALNHGWPAISHVAFAFTLSASTRVRVALAKLVRGRGHWRWQVLRDSITIPARKGRNRVHLRARGRLAPGRYRLTLTPVHGGPLSLVLYIR
ncbi:MAG: hypothetical protein ACHQCH_00540 [Solirubrobacterales bacterium]